MSGGDDVMKTTVLKRANPQIAEALEPRAPRAKLSPLGDPPAGGGPFWLEQRAQSIGRDSSNSIRVDVAGVSRTHARIFSDSGGWVVEDLGSRNGVWLNGARVRQPRRMADGDVLRFAQCAFRLDLEPPSRRTPDEPAAAGRRAESVEDEDEDEETMDLDTEAIKAGILAATGRTPAPPPRAGEPAPGPPAGSAVLAARLAEHAEAIMETVVRRAAEGEPAALALAVERLWPREERARLNAPKGSLLAEAQQVVHAFESDRLTLDQAEAMLRGLLLEPKR